MPFYATWTQWFPPRHGAPITEANLPSQSGKVFIVTGGSSGIGYELARILYGAGGKVYILTRSKEHADDAIARIKAFYDRRGHAEKQRGSLAFISMDLSDLASVKAAAQEFLKLEGPDGRLDVLFNNAGTGARKKAPPTRQGHEYHFGTNIIGPFLLARLLSPILSKTAKQSAPGSVRVVWSASLAVDMFSPKGGVRRDFLRDPAATATRMRPFAIYSASKAANWFVAAEFARRQPDGDDENGDDGDGGSGGGAVLHIAGNPGNYNTSIWRHTPALVVWLLRPTLRHPVHGAETNLFMGCSDSVTLADAAAGRYAICDGRWHPAPRKDLLLALRGEEEGGTGQARECFEWCEERVREFLE